MSNGYFPDLYNWLRSDGYAIVSEYLHTFAIPFELNPAIGCQRAPDSSTASEVLAASSGSLEQEIGEAIAQGLPGFSGGWISSIYLDRMMERMGLTRKISHIRRKEMLESMGYRWHPALVDGRVHNPILPDSGKPRLYIHDSSLARQITNPSEAGKAYERENNHKVGSQMPFPLRIER